MATNGQFDPFQNFDLPNLAQKVSISAVFRSGCKISMKNTIWEDQNDQMCDFGLQMVIFDPFQTLPCEGRKF